MKFEILRNSRDYSSRKDCHTAADTGTGENGYIAVYDTVVSNFHVLINSREITDLDIVTNLGIRTYLIKIAHIEEITCF